MIKKVAAGILILFSLGCATTGFTQADRRQAVTQLISAIRQADQAVLSEVLQTPFLLDTEIVEIKEELIGFWQQYGSRAFLQGSEEHISLMPLRASDYSRWGTSNDIEQFFQKYVPAGSYLVQMSDSNKLYYLIVKLRSSKLPLFYGYKGGSL